MAVRENFGLLKISLFVASWTSFFGHFGLLGMTENTSKSKAKMFHVFGHGITSAKNSIVEAGEEPAQNFCSVFRSVDYR
jgi:hypothetical protein